MPPIRPDISDRLEIKTDVSDLSGIPHPHLAEKSENIPQTRTDNTDRLDPKTNVSVLSVPSRPLLEENSLTHLRNSLLDDYEERLAISEYDGDQSPLQAHSIAYLDAFISILLDQAEDSPHQDSLAQQIQVALAILETQRFQL